MLVEHFSECAKAVVAPAAVPAAVTAAADGKVVPGV
jgi:hypothetical protein